MAEKIKINSKPADQPESDETDEEYKDTSAEKKPTTKVTMKRAGDITSFMPKKGEEITPYESKFGDLEITSLQLPTVADCKVGEKYTFIVEAVMRDNRIAQDDKYDSKSSKHIATSDPYIKGKFEIKSVKEQGKTTEPLA